MVTVIIIRVLLVANYHHALCRLVDVDSILILRHLLKALSHRLATSASQTIRFAIEVRLSLSRLSIDFFRAIRIHSSRVHHLPSR